jgi:hypothetical protein
LATCLGIFEHVDAYQAFSTDSRTLALCFEADKHPFRRWMRAVGIVDGRVVADAHHPLLDDTSVAPLVYKIVSCVCTLWGGAGSDSTLLSEWDLKEPDAASDQIAGGGGGVSGTTTSKQLWRKKHHTLAAKRAKLGWALGGKA